MKVSFAEVEVEVAARVAQLGLAKRRPEKAVRRFCRGCQDALLQCRASRDLGDSGV